MNKLASFLFFSLFFATSLHAETTLLIENSWVREAPPTVKILAAYMTLQNPSDEDITLIAAKSPLFNGIMFHKTELSDGIAKMRHEEKIIIPAHSSFTLKPGGVHLMLMGRQKSLRQGDQVELQLIFANNPCQTIYLPVKKIATE